MQISVIVPVYYGANVLEELVTRISNSVATFTEEFEVILVEDNSPDNSWQKIKEVCLTNKKVKGVKLSRNFGQHYAITAGLDKSVGERVIVMDCDLQDEPEEIPNLYNKSIEGYHIVLARRFQRKDSFLKKLSSKTFSKVLGYFTDTVQDPTIGNFGIYHRDVVKSILAMKDNIRYLPTMLQWVGFTKTKINVRHNKRKEGDSSYSWAKLFQLASNNIIAFSNKPLRLVIKVGFGISLISFLIGLVYLYKYFIGDIVVLGFASIIISIWFLSGLKIFMLGVIGVYLGKTFDKVKNRPVFIIEQTLNF